MSPLLIKCQRQEEKQLGMLIFNYNKWNNNECWKKTNETENRLVVRDLLCGIEILPEWESPVAIGEFI